MEDYKGRHGGRGGRGRHGRRGGRGIPPPMPPSYPGSGYRWPWWHGGYRRWWYRPSWYNPSWYYAPAWLWASNQQPATIVRNVVVKPQYNWTNIILAILVVLFIIYLIILLFKK